MSLNMKFFFFEGVPKDPLKGLDLDTNFRPDLETSHKFPKVHRLRVEELGTPH